METYFIFKYPFDSNAFNTFKHVLWSTPDFSDISDAVIYFILTHPYNLTIYFPAQPLHGGHADIHQFRTLFKRHILTPVFKKCTFVLCEIAFCPEVI